MPNFLPVCWSADRREAAAFSKRLYALLESDYGIHRINFDNLMALTSATLAGSTPLQVLLNENWIDSDLDIYLSSDEDVSLWNGYLLSAGYMRNITISCGRVAYTEFAENNRLGGAIHSIANYKRNNLRGYKIVQLIKGDKQKILDSVDLGLSTVRATLNTDNSWKIICHQNYALLKKRVSYYVQPISTLTDSELSSRREKYERGRGFTILLKQPEFVDVSAIMDARAAREAISSIEAAAATAPPPPFVEPSPQMPSPLRIRTPGSSPSPRHVNALSPSLQMQVRGDSQMAVSPSAFRAVTGPPAGPQLSELMANISQIPHAETDNTFITIPPMPTHHPKLRRCKAYSGAEDEASPVARNTSDLEIQPTEVPTSIPRIHIVRSSNTLATHVTELSEA